MFATWVCLANYQATARFRARKGHFWCCPEAMVALYLMPQAYHGHAPNFSRLPILSELASKPHKT